MIENELVAHAVPRGTAISRYSFDIGPLYAPAIVRVLSAHGKMGSRAVDRWAVGAIQPVYSSGNGGACVEVASDQPARPVLMRDTQDRGGFTLHVPADEWRGFTGTIK